MGGFFRNLREEHEVNTARKQGEQGVRQDYANKKVDDANAQGYANFAERDYVAKYGDTGRSDAADSTRPDEIARGGGAGTQQRKAKRLFSDMVGSQQPANLISA